MGQDRARIRRMDLSEFLIARIAEQEERCKALLKSPALPHTLAVRRTLTVALADCAAKRAIIRQARWTGQRLEPVAGDVVSFPIGVLFTLAQPYADHPDYDPAWVMHAVG